MIKVVFVCFALLLLPKAYAQPLRPPFDGQWFVVQAGDTPNVNHHMTQTAQQFGIDFAKLGGDDSRELARPNASRLEDYYSWSAPVLAPHDGEVVGVVNNLPDNPLGTKDPDNPAGNYVSIRIAPDRYIFLAHLKHMTVIVKRGDRVTAGQFLAQCGNSGNSDYPHIHLHIQDQPGLFTGSGQNPIFGGVDIRLNGKLFLNVSWPLIRGLFIQLH